MIRINSLGKHFSISVLNVIDPCVNHDGNKHCEKTDDALTINNETEHTTNG